MSAPRELSPCGTHAAFRRHCRRGEIACEECLQAHREYERRRYEQRRRVAA